MSSFLLTETGDHILTEAGGGLILDAVPVSGDGYDLVCAKAKLGITDTAQDVAIQASLDQALAVAELYCNRKFKLMDDVDTFTHMVGRTVSLKRYPIVSMTKVTDAIDYHADHVNGVVHFDSYSAHHEMVVEYRGGYTNFPPDLLLALCDIFGVVWDMSHGAGVSTGGIKTVRAGDLSITYDTGSGAAASTSGGGFGGLISPFAASILDLYKREDV